MGLLSFFNREVAMDLGTANSIVIYNDQVVIDEPSIVAVAHPGGSIHDQDSIDYCEKNKMGMAITGKRHFKH